MKTKIIAAVVIIVVIALAFPLSNSLARPAINYRLTDSIEDDPQFARVAEVLEIKCHYCHIPDANMPFYANFPIAKQMMDYDVYEGLKHFDFTLDLMPKVPGAPAQEVGLAKLEFSLIRNDMPPTEFAMMHWYGTLSSQEKEDIMAWIKDTRVAHYAPEGLPREVAERVIHPIPQSVDVNERQVELGDLLFHDKRLSVDNTVSCATCHDLVELGGTDQLQVSVGVFDQLGPINSPTVFNAKYNILQFWDGRAADLQEQAGMPVEDLLEMASEWPDVIEKLEQDEEFAERFRQVYPEGLSKETVTHAIAEFERTLITPNSPFDKFLMGYEDALTEQERGGYDLFLDFNCATCHVGVLMGGQSFELMGLKADYFADRGPLDIIINDDGRYGVTGKERDLHRFKVPTLRNIALTHPYYHDGTVETLEDAVEMMVTYQVDRTISDAQIDDIVAFLHTLTGEFQGEPLS